MKIKRVLHITEAPLGGVISHMEELLRYQSEKNIEHIDIISPQLNRDIFLSIKSKKVSVICFKHVRGSIISLLKLAYLTVKHSRGTRPDIIHVHSTIAGVVVRAIRPLLPSKSKIIYCPHGWVFDRDGNFIINRIYGILEFILSYFSDAIICISDYEKRSAIKIGISTDKLIVIENGVSPFDISYNSNEKRQDGQKLIAFIGRFDPQKGFDTFLGVLKELKSEARGVAVGQFIVSKAKFPKIPSNVELRDWMPRDQVFALYREADLVLMPSRWEGFGLVALEAMQAKTAVFASRVGGLQDVVLDGETGRLFDPNDVDNILKIIRSTSIEELNLYGINGRNRYTDRYTATKMNYKVICLYEKLNHSD